MNPSIKIKCISCEDTHTYYFGDTNSDLEFTCKTCGRIQWHTGIESLRREYKSGKKKFTPNPAEVV